MEHIKFLHCHLSKLVPEQGYGARYDSKCMPVHCDKSHHVVLLNFFPVLEKPPILQQPYFCHDAVLSDKATGLLVCLCAVCLPACFLLSAACTLSALSACSASAKQAHLVIICSSLDSLTTPLWSLCMRCCPEDSRSRSCDLFNF